MAIEVWPEDDIVITARTVRGDTIVTIEMHNETGEEVAIRLSLARFSDLAVGCNKVAIDFWKEHAERRAE